MRWDLFVIYVYPVILKRKRKFKKLHTLPYFTNCVTREKNLIYGTPTHLFKDVMHSVVVTVYDNSLVLRILQILQHVFHALWIQKINFSCRYGNAPFKGQL